MPRGSRRRDEHVLPAGPPDELPSDSREGALFQPAAEGEHEGEHKDTPSGVIRRLVRAATGQRPLVSSVVGHQGHLMGHPTGMGLQGGWLQLANLTAVAAVVVMFAYLGLFLLPSFYRDLVQTFREESKYNRDRIDLLHTWDDQRWRTTNDLIRGGVRTVEENRQIFTRQWQHLEEIMAKQDKLTKDQAAVIKDLKDKLIKEQAVLIKDLKDIIRRLKELEVHHIRGVPPCVVGTACTAAARAW